MSLALTLALAISLDLIFGDPRSRWHPVCLVGHLATFAEKQLRRRSDLAETTRGGLFLAIVLFGSLLPVALLTLFARVFPGGWILDALLFYFALGGSTLGREARHVALSLSRNKLPEARQALSMLVSRDTGDMDEIHIAGSTLETVAENFSDAFVATLLYGVLGGPLLAWAHRVANTLDAMVGYKTPRYLHFGRASARFDDAMNYLPARLSALVLALAAPAAGGHTKKALQIARQDGRLLESPNAGWPIAACAGALDVRLGGPARYFGRVEEKPFLGNGRFPTARDLERGLCLYWCAYALSTALALLGALLLWGNG